MPILKPPPGVLNRLRSMFRMREAPTGNQLVVPEQQRLVAPEQLQGEDEQLFRALTESGYSLADALEAIRQEGLQAEMSRRDLFRLGRDTAMAGSTLSNLGALRNLVPDIRTDAYPEVSRERILGAVRPLLEQASPATEWVSEFAGDFLKYSDYPSFGDDPYYDPDFENKISAHLSKYLKTADEREEADYLLSNIPANVDSVDYYIGDGRPKELWRNEMEEHEVMPNWGKPGALVPPEPFSRVTDDNDWAELTELFDPGFPDKLEAMTDLSTLAAERYLEDPVEASRFMGMPENEIKEYFKPATDVNNSLDLLNKEYGVSQSIDDFMNIEPDDDAYVEKHKRLNAIMEDQIGLLLDNPNNEIKTAAQDYLVDRSGTNLAKLAYHLHEKVYWRPSQGKYTESLSDEFKLKKPK